MSKLKIVNRKSAIVTLILRWYAPNGRMFPWRRTHNPYRVLVSEVMLQQTQASRVAEKYPRFLKRFPSFSSLARAKKSSVIRAWRGMGYNNRAIRLQELARIVHGQYSGKLPKDIETLQQLPGVGRYTAHAIACFAFRQQAPVVDTNVRRVLSRLFPRQAERGDIWELAASLLPPTRAYDWNQALFDFGATVCSEISPACTTCPLSSRCPSAFRIVRRRSTRSRREPGRDGIPNRMYRGRIVEALRSLRLNRSISDNVLGKRIKRNYTSRDSRWLRGLLHSLERDGVIALRNGSASIRVSLAE